MLLQLLFSLVTLKNREIKPCSVRLLLLYALDVFVCVCAFCFLLRCVHCIFFTFYRHSYGMIGGTAIATAKRSNWSPRWFCFSHLNFSPFSLLFCCPSFCVFLSFIYFRHFMNRLYYSCVCHISNHRHSNCLLYACSCIRKRRTNFFKVFCCDF